jgi:hypothetical protein
MIFRVAANVPKLVLDIFNPNGVQYAFAPPKTNVEQ